jgi:hypothetical protein
MSGISISMDRNSANYINATDVSGYFALNVAGNTGISQALLFKNDLSIVLPSSVSAVGTVTGSNLSGTNTGDQNLSGYLLNTTDTLTGDLSVTGDVDLTTGQLEMRSVVALDHDGSSLYLKAPGTIFFFSGNANNGHINSSGNATFTGTVEASNLSGTNTGDEDLTTYVQKYTRLISEVTTSVEVTHSLNNAYPQVQVFEGADLVLCEVENTSASITTLKFNVAPTANQYRVVIHG